MRPFRPRGWFLLAAGALALTLAGVLGRRDLLLVAIFCTALPAVACAGLYSFKPGFSVRRELSPRLARVGQPVQVVLEVRGHGPAGTHTQLIEELPASFHENPRFSHPHPVVPHGLVSRYQYRAVPSQRGVFGVGPLRGLFADPFDVAFLQRGLDAGEQLTVAPAAVELSHIPLSEGRGRDGNRSSAELANASADDAMTRDYRPGDPLRRVHWAVTARQGKLMVRAEESVTAPEAAIIVDQRQLAFGDAARFAFHAVARPHHGGAGGAGTAGAGGAGAAGTGGSGALPVSGQPLRTTAAFEKAVIAVVSVATHLLERGYALRVVDHDGGPGFASSPSAAAPLLEDFSGAQGVVDVAVALAALELSEATEPAKAAKGAKGTLGHPAFGDSLADKLHRGRRRGPLVAVVGHLTVEEALRLASTGESTQWAAALIVCYAPAEAAPALEILRRAGWQAAALTPKSALDAAWESLSPSHVSRMPS